MLVNLHGLINFLQIPHCEFRKIKLQKLNISKEHGLICPKQSRIVWNVSNILMVIQKMNSTGFFMWYALKRKKEKQNKELFFFLL